MVVDGSALDEVLAACSPEALDGLDHHLACALFDRRELLEGSGVRLAVEGSSDGGLVLLRCFGHAEAVRVRVLPLDPADALDTRDERANALLRTLETATGAEYGLSVVEWFVVVDGDPAPGQLAWTEARTKDPEVQVGDELGLPNLEATRRLRAAVLEALRRARPLTLRPALPGAEAAVEAAVTADARRVGREPEALLRPFVGLRDVEAIERGIQTHAWDLEAAVWETDPDAEPPPSALASLVPLDASLTEAFVAKVLSLHPPPPPPTHDADALLRRWVEGHDVAEEAATLEPTLLTWLIDRLGSYVDVDHAWHQLFALARSCPHARPRIEAALEPWSDAARVMPRTWFAEIQAGHYDPAHRLVRELLLDENEWPLLLKPGIEESLGGLSGLGLRVPPDAMPALVERPPNLPNLRTLVCLALVWSDALARSMASTATWPGLTRLVLRDNPMHPEHLAELFVGTSFPALTMLEVFHASDRRAVPATPLRLVDVARALEGRPLRRSGFCLRATGLAIDAEGLRAFVAEPAARALSGLDVIASPLQAADLAILAAAPLSLASLTLHQGQVGPEGARALAGASWRGGLRDLRLSNQAIGDDAMAELLTSLADAPVRSLALLHNQLGPRTSAALGALRWPRLERLELSHNRFTDEDVAQVLANPAFRSLQHFEALGTGASEATAKALAQGSFPDLKVLNLGDAFGDRAAAILASARNDAGGLPSLKRLQLRGAGDEAMAALERPGVYATNAMFA